MDGFSASGFGDNFYGEGGFLPNPYFPQMDDHKLTLTDVMELYPQSDKMITNAQPSDMGRKRRDTLDDQEFTADGKQMRLMPPDEQKKYLRENHSQIEKRRRDKMNTYITELCSMIPTCKAMSRKTDKLTVLRFAVQHLKTIRGSLDSYTEGNYKPPMLTDKELKQLIIPCADGFMFVVDSARGRILFVSESVSDTLNFSSQDLIGQSLFDILHPKDIPKVKEQLSNSDSTPRERLIDSKTMLPLKGGEVPQSISRLHPGARRVFFCRMKCKQTLPPVKQEDDMNPSPMLNSTYGSSSSTGGKKKKSSSLEKKYLSIQCTGYLKSWPLTKVGLDQDFSDPDSQDGDSCMSCLVAVGRLQPSFKTTIDDCLDKGQTTAPGVEFTSRHGTDGKFSYVDQRVTLLLGYLPQELIGTSLYEHIQFDDIPAISECHRNALKQKEEVCTPYFRFRAKDGKFVKLESKWKQFRNPWTKDIEYLICKNYLLISDEKLNDGGSFVDSGDMNFFSKSSGNSAENSNSNGPMGKDIQRVISSHADAAKIGRRIAEEARDKFRYDSSASNSPLSLQAASPRAFIHQRNPSESSDGTERPSADNQLLASAIAEVEQDRSKLCGGVIVSRSSNNCPSTSKGQSVRPEAKNNQNPPNTPGPSQQQLSNRGQQMSLSEQIMQGAMNARRNSPPSSSASSEGNDDAAMAVIMSLLEADAGLGGPVDFSGLPWPLP